MAYDIQSTSMLIGSISGDKIKIIFNPKLEKLFTGDSIKIVDEEKQGIVAQIYQIENLDFASVTDEALKSQIAHFNSISSNTYEDDINSLHVATGKIKLSIIGNKWINWRGNLPSMADFVDVVPPTEIISHTIGSSPLNPINLGHFVSHYTVPLVAEASLLETTSLIVGDRSKEKANLLNIIQSELVNKQAKVLVIDPKGAYHNLKDAKVLEAGKNFKLSLIEYGIQTLGALISGQIEANLKHKIESLYVQLTNRALSMTKEFLPLNLLRELLEKEMQTPEGQKRIPELGTLRNRIIAINKLGIFANTPDELCDIGTTFNNRGLIVLDISNIPLFWQKVFLNSSIKDLSTYDGCAFVFYEDISKYIDQEMAIDLLYKTKNHGLNSIFITNYEDEIPVEIIKQAENLFMFSTDNLDGNNKFYSNLKADKTLLNMLLKRQPENTVLIHGDISNSYPILVELHDSNLSSLRSRHFGSIKKYVSEYGEIIYSYKSLHSSGIDQKMDIAEGGFHQQMGLGEIEIPETIAQAEQEAFEDYSGYTSLDLDQYAPSTLQQSSFMEKYQNISEEYEEELLATHSSLDDDELDGFDIQIHPQPVQTQYSETLAHHIPDDEFMPQQRQQQPSQQHYQESIVHHISDEEFIPQHMQQPQPPQHQQQRMPLPQQQQQHYQESIVHHIPDDEFMPQQRQQQHYQESIVHHIPDDEFIPQQIQQQRPPQGQQRTPQQPQQRQQTSQQHYQESIVHHIPDDEFMPQQIQIQGPPPAQQRMPQHPQQRQPQQMQQHSQESIAHHIPDDEFMPQQMRQQAHPQQQQQRMPQQPQQRQPQQMPQHSQDHMTHHLSDDEFMNQQQRRPQPQQQQKKHYQESIVHHIPDDEFMPQQMQPQTPYNKQQQQPEPYPMHKSASQSHARIRPESIPDQLEDIPVYASPNLGAEDIDFQEGDRVHHERYGIGIINRIITTGDKKLCSIQFQDFGRRLLDPKRGLTKLGD
ncbi:MAG: DUF87 domain-containing protein [Cyanobacteriota bacterium]